MDDRPGRSSSASKLAAPAPRFSATPAVTGEPAELGADTAELLGELGYDHGEIADLRDAGAIG